MNNNFIVRIKASEITGSLLENAVILNWELIQNKVDLLNPFYTKYCLKNYIWEYSLDTFYDIFSDKDFIKKQNIIIIISNYDKLLQHDIQRKCLFLDTLVSLVVNSVDIEYQVYIVV